MNLKTNFLNIVGATIAALFLAFPVSHAGAQVTQASKPSKTTKIYVNGLFAEMLLVDAATSTNGFLAVSKDSVENTTAIYFSYASPDPSDPDHVAILIQGAGLIPNNAFAITSTTAHVAITTPFAVNRCAINTFDGTFFCTVLPSSRFDLTWTANGYGTVTEKAKRIETLGPVTTKSQGEFKSRTAMVVGTWDGHVAHNEPGTLLETQGFTAIREITAPATP